VAVKAAAFAIFFRIFYVALGDLRAQYLPLLAIVGIIYERRHTRMIADYGGLGHVMPVYATIFLIMTMSSIGLPTLNGFIGEFMILQGVFGQADLRLWAVIGASGIVLGAAYMLWLYQRTMLGKIENDANRKLRDLSLRELATFVPLIVLAFWIGLYPQPFLRYLDEPVKQIVERVRPGFYQASTGTEPATSTGPRHDRAARVSERAIRGNQ